jgi:hypothetical protein
VVISTIVMAAVVVACRAFLPAAHGLWLSLSQLVVLALLGAASYLLSCAGLWALARFPEGPERHTLSLIEHGLARLSNGLRGQPSSDIG